MTTYTYRWSAQGFLVYVPISRKLSRRVYAAPYHPRWTPWDIADYYVRTEKRMTNLERAIPNSDSEF